MMATIQDTALIRLPETSLSPIDNVYSTAVNIRSMAIAAIENRNIIR